MELFLVVALLLVVLFVLFIVWTALILKSA